MTGIFISMKKAFFLIFFASCLGYLITKTSSLLQAQTKTTTLTNHEAQNEIPFRVQVTATVPGYFWLELSGWTSPWAQVELTMGQALRRLTKANEKGKFVFRLTLPRELGHFCLITTDISRISSQPLCIPPPPPSENILIKEVVMPPTFKIDKGKVLEGETVAAQGYTTPDSPVVAFAFEPKRWSRFGPLISSLFPFSVSSALAAEVPKPPIKSDQNGFYQFNLPTSTLGKNRIFTSSIFLSNPSPKSTTLVFDILSWWRMIFEKILAWLGNLLALVIAFLKSPQGIIILETVIIGILVLVFWRRRKAQKEPAKSKSKLVRVRF